VERHDVLAREAGDRRRRPRRRQAVRIGAVDQPIEHRVGEKPGILQADLQVREHLLPLPFDVVRRERGAPRHVRQQAQPVVEAVLHHDHVDEAEIRTRARAGRRAHEVDLVGERRGVHRRGALVEQRGRQVREAELVGRLRRTAGAHEQPQAHHGLLVVQHGHDLKAVGQRAHVIGREVHVVRLERPRRALARPLEGLRIDERRHEECKNAEMQECKNADLHECRNAEGTLRHAVTPPHSCIRAFLHLCIPAFLHSLRQCPSGRIVMTTRFSGRKYVRATRCTSAVVMCWKMSNSPSAVVMSSWMTTACDSISALS
jgi:hypothetical protein